MAFPSRGGRVEPGRWWAREAGARLQLFLSAVVTIPCQLQRKEAGVRDTANLGSVILGDTRAQQHDTAAGDTTQNVLGSPDTV